MSSDANVRLPEPLLAQMREAAAREGKSVDELTEEAAKRLLSQRLLEKFRQQAEERRRSVTETEVEEPSIVPFPSIEPNPARRLAESFETGKCASRSTPISTCPPSSSAASA